MTSRRRTLTALSAVAALAVGWALPSRAAAPGLARSAGSVIQLAKPSQPSGAHQPGPSCSSANCSSNWFGYNQGALEKGTALSPASFHAISGSWRVPRASEHTKGEDEYSSTWVGIGGGCVDSSCLITDSTLIQAGTEQDVIGGKPQYSAWWEVIPAPSLTISNMTVKPGDQMSVHITETPVGSEIWTINVKDVTENESFTQTVPYTSSYATAEWIEETPLEIGTNTGFAALPNLSTTTFDPGTVNGGNPRLVSPEALYLANANTGQIYSVPSAPDSDTDGFNACAWSTSCSTPGS